MLTNLPKISRTVFAVLTIISIIAGCGPLTPVPTLAPVVTPSANSALTPQHQPVADQDVWLDEAINIMRFSPTESLIFHFTRPMSPASSATPILSWPSVEGINSWNESKTTLTFKPTSVLDSKKTYTFFIDPELQFADGAHIEKSAEWTIYINSGPKIVNVSPKAGPLSHLFETIEIRFDRNMHPSNIDSLFSITPQIPYEISWKSPRVLQINLQQPLSTEQRYDLTLRTNEGLLAEDGSYLAEDYRWFYWQSPLHTNVKTTRKNAVELDFNYTFDKEKSGLPFQIFPELKGEWRWMSPQKVIFIADNIIPASQEYEVTINSTLVDKSGFRISQIPITRFSGIPPIRMENQGFDRQSDDMLIAEPNLDVIRLEFDIPVNHSSAEEAFSLTPVISGAFQWEKNAAGSKEVLVYTFDNLLEESTVYTLKIDPNLLDNEGRDVIVQPYQQQFQRAYWSDLSPSFGQEGDNIQVIDANGPRRLQISENNPDISFTAYSFDLSEYADLYAQHYRTRTRGNNVLDIPISPGLSSKLTWTNVSERKVENDYTITETVVPPDLTPGLYVVDMKVKNRLYDQLFLVISENTLLVKNDGDNLYVWLTNINGGVVADAEIRLYSDTGEKIREGKTDENGQYKVAIPRDTNPELVTAFVQKPGRPNDTVISGFYRWESNHSGYSWWDSFNMPESKSFLTYIYTERPLYRPGQTVHFKAIVRKDDDLKYTLPNVGMPVQVLVKDGRENTIDTFEFTTNEFGTINGSFEVPQDAVLGLYTIETQTDGVITQESFKVEDYRKPDYQVNLTSLQPDKTNKFVLGEEVKIQVNSAYYFGEPVANARLNVNFFMPWPTEANVTGPLKTDENGNATLSFRAPYDDSRYYYDNWRFRLTPQTVRMEVTVNDGSNQTVTGVYSFQVYPASEIPSIQTDGYFFQPNKAFLVKVQDVDLFGLPVVGREISLTTHSWNRDKYEFNTASQSFKLQTNSQGMITQEITLESGYHKLSLQTKDATGHNIEVSKWVYIFKDKNDWFYWHRWEQIQISTEKDSYKPYEKAKLMIESTFSGPALITFERGSVINSKLIELTAPLTIFETDIIPEHAPNVYVNVNAWQASSENVHRDSYADPYSSDSDSYLRMAETQIQVDASSKELEINITTDKQTYEPGEKVTTIIDVVDKDGNPGLAELSLAVVDESIFALADEFSLNIFDSFYGPRQNTVSTFDSMSPIRVIFPGDFGGGGDELPPTARSEFVDTSAWLPVIQTDKNGQAIVSFNLPDNMTSWRLTVKAVTLNHLVGQASANIESTKEVFIRPVLPRVLTRGDQATLTAFIHNYSDQEKKLTVNFAADGLDVQGNNTSQTITLKAGEVLPIGWSVLVNRAPPTEINIAVQENNKVLDAVKMPLLLQPAAVRDVQNQSGEFIGTLVLDVALPNVDVETSQAILTLNQSMSGTLLNGIEYLIGYPYGCVEQTMSRALPNAVVGRSADQLGIGGPALQNQLDPLIKASINKLYSLQHGDGGWGWWNDDISDEYQTAWVLFGLGILEESGYTIEPKVLDNAVSWLNGQVTRYSDFDIRTRAYSLYSMAQAGRGNLEVTQKLVSESIYELDPFSQAALALALNKMGEKEQAQEILDLLTQSVEETDGLAYWPQPNYDGEYHSKTMASTTRTTAIVLLAYAKLDPQNELIPGIVQYLSSQRKGIYGWGTTNETSFVILALTEYLISQEKEIGSVPYQVSLGGKEIYTGTLEVGKASISLDIPVSDLKSGGNTILVSTQSDRPLYFDLSTKYDLLQKDVSAAGNVKVTRKYLDPKTNKPLEVIQAGELVKVELTINIPENAYFIAVEDYLPGGLEALNEGLSAISQSSSYDSYYYESYWQDYGYNYKEIRGDRVVFFITTFEKGRRVLTYYARATNSGQFTALPTQVYAMYDASIWGRSETVEVRVE